MISDIDLKKIHDRKDKGLCLVIPFLLVLSASLWASCRQAIYEIVKPATNNEGDPQNPESFQESGKTKPVGPGPTARVEVIWEGKSVTQVKVNQPTIIRPTADTLDPDDLGKSDCPNPGITKAEYQIGSESSPIVDRGKLCEALSVPYTFKTEGDYVIKMTVTSNEGETALAAMTLKVVSDLASDFGGFAITANPLLAKVGQNIDFKGFCTTKNTKVISWKFADGATAEGEATTHSYSAPGSYKVDAKCQENSGSGRSWNAAVTVVVLNDVPTPPPSSLPPEAPTVPTPPPPPPVTPPPAGPLPPDKSGGGGTTTGGGFTIKKCWFIFHCNHQ